MKFKPNADIDFDIDYQNSLNESWIERLSLGSDASDQDSDMTKYYIPVQNDIQTQEWPNILKSANWKNNSQWSCSDTWFNEIDDIETSFREQLKHKIELLSKIYWDTNGDLSNDDEVETFANYPKSIRLLKLCPEMDDRSPFKDTKDSFSESYDFNMTSNDWFSKPSIRVTKIQNESSEVRAEEYFKNFDNFLFCNDIKLEPAKDYESEQDSIKLTKKNSHSTDIQSPIKQWCSIESTIHEQISEKVFQVKPTTRKSHKNKDKTTEYHYLLERKAIRMMRRYYKETFETYANQYKFKQKMKSITSKLSSKYFLEYVELEFKDYPNTMKYLQPDYISEKIQELILWDRYKKGEDLTKGLYFDEIRQLLTKFNHKFMAQFLKNEVHSLLFVHYFKMKSMYDAEMQNHVDQEKLAKQMEKMYGVCRKNLSNMLPTGLLWEVH